MADADTAYALSADRYTMVIRRRTPAGIQTVTIRRQDDAGPFTDEDVTAALEWPPGDSGQPGQRNTARRKVTRAGTVMAGWLRLAVAAKWERPGKDPADE